MYKVTVTKNTYWHTLYLGGSAKKALEAFNIGRSVLLIGRGTASIAVYDGDTEALQVDYSEGRSGMVTGPAVHNGLGNK